MKTYLDCVPCFLRQALEAGRAAGCDDALQEQILRQVAAHLPRLDFAMPPPVMGQKIHRIVREIAGTRDPYCEAKRRFNRVMLQLLPRLRNAIRTKRDPFAAALALAAAGNVIDFGPTSHIDDTSVVRQLDEALDHAFAASMVDRLKRRLAGARSILLIADNAGEIVLDRLLLEQLTRDYPVSVTVGVRGMPIINDALFEDAVETGVTELARVIENGSDAPGTILDDCSADFRSAFDRADVVVAKGQGNYETLSGLNDVWFLLKAKCPVLAADIGCAVGDLVVQPGSDGCRGVSDGHTRT
jgi:uncharacterized protein with ATP-grasp and redox domains